MSNELPAGLEDALIALQAATKSVGAAEKARMERVMPIQAEIESHQQAIKDLSAEAASRREVGLVEDLRFLRREWARPEACLSPPTRWPVRDCARWPPWAAGPYRLDAHRLHSGHPSAILYPSRPGVEVVKRFQSKFLLSFANRKRRIIGLKREHVFLVQGRKRDFSTVLRLQF